MAARSKLQMFTHCSNLMTLHAINNIYTTDKLVLEQISIEWWHAFYFVTITVNKKGLTYVLPFGAEII
jgi:hypothetical protein